jgi:hypothetical protein
VKYPASPLTPFPPALPENSHLLHSGRSSICTTARKVNPGLSHCSGLFVIAKKVNSFAISQMRTLSQKHRGVGYPAPFRHLGSAFTATIVPNRQIKFSARSCFQLMSCSFKTIDQHIPHFHGLTNCFFGKLFLFTSIQIAGGVTPNENNRFLSTRPGAHETGGRKSRVASFGMRVWG